MHEEVKNTAAASAARDDADDERPALTTAEFNATRYPHGRLVRILEKAAAERAEADAIARLARLQRIAASADGRRMSSTGGARGSRTSRGSRDSAGDSAGGARRASSMAPLNSMAAHMAHVELLTDLASDDGSNADADADAEPLTAELSTVSAESRYRIAEFCGPDDLLLLMLACRGWRDLCLSETLWCAPARRRDATVTGWLPVVSCGAGWCLVVSG